VIAAAQLFQHLAISAYLHNMEERVHNVRCISTNLDLQEGRIDDNITKEM
jgi:hypothetical protein